MFWVAQQEIIKKQEIVTTEFKGLITPLAARKRWSKYEFFMTLKLILDFLFTYSYTDLSQRFRMYLMMVFEVKYFIHVNAMGMIWVYKRWRKVICVVKLTD